MTDIKEEFEKLVQDFNDKVEALTNTYNCLPLLRQDIVRTAGSRYPARQMLNIENIVLTAKGD